MVVTIGIAEDAANKIREHLTDVKTVAIVEDAAKAAAAAVATAFEIVKFWTIKLSHNNRATIVSRNQNVVPRTLGSNIMNVAAAAVEENGTMAGAGKKIGAATLITLNWGHVTNALSKSFSVSVTPVLTLTNTRIYPWRRRARMYRLTSHHLMTCS